jgi:hypothetical protein
MTNSPREAAMRSMSSTGCEAGDDEEAEAEAERQALADAWLAAHVNIFTPLYVIAAGLLEPYTRDPRTWPLRPGRPPPPEDDPV